MYNNFLLIPNPTKPESVDFVSVAARHIADCGKKATVPMKYKNLVGDAPSVVFAADDDLAGVDIAVVLGGDGTVLRNIDYIRRLGVPLFGVNFGHLGYLTQCEPELAIECLDRVMRGDFEIEERIMLNCRIVSGGKVREFTGLNEVVLHRAAFAGALHVTVHINGNFIERFAADGVLVSGCHPRDCHYSAGNYYARRRLEVLKQFLPVLGIDDRRFEYTWVSASEGQRWQHVVTTFTDRIHKLGPAPRLEDAGPLFRIADMALTSLRPLGTGQNAALDDLKAAIKARLPELDCVIGWQRGYDAAHTVPLFMRTPEDVDKLVWGQ